MKNITLFCLLLFSVSLVAQPPLDTMVTDCNGNTKNIQTVLGTGKALIIAHKGVDCSICRSSAPNLQTFAAQNSSRVEVWGAMTWKYNQSSFTPACTETQNWKNQYNWNDIFTFADNNRAWLASGTPRYYVYSPRDSSIVWQGSNQVTATQRALQESTVGISEEQRADPVRIFGYDHRIQVLNIPSNISAIRLVNTSGQVVFEDQNVNSSTFQINSLKNGIYFVQLEEDGQYVRAKKVVLY